MASALCVLRIRSTAASEPGPTAVFVRTIESYCSNTHPLWQIFGAASIAASVPFQSRSKGYRRGSSRTISSM